MSLIATEVIRKHITMLTQAYLTTKYNNRIYLCIMRDSSLYPVWFSIRNALCLLCAFQESLMVAIFKFFTTSFSPPLYICEGETWRGHCRQMPPSSSGREKPANIFLHWWAGWNDRNGITIIILLPIFIGYFPYDWNYTHDLQGLSQSLFDNNNKKIIIAPIL